VLFDALETSFKDTQQATLINDLYQGMWRRCHDMCLCSEPRISHLSDSNISTFFAIYSSLTLSRTHSLSRYVSLDDLLTHSLTATHSHAHAGRIADYVHCRSCGATNEKRDSILDVSLVVRGVTSLEAALGKILEPEMLEGDNGMDEMIC
jgi:hypothetical protein